jgi:hypothetical protein
VKKAIKAKIDTGKQHTGQTENDESNMMRYSPSAFNFEQTG